MSKHKSKTKTIIGITAGVAVLVAVVGVTAWLTKGFKSPNVLDVTKQGTVVATFDNVEEMYELIPDYYSIDETIMLGSEDVYQETDKNEWMSNSLWEKVSIDNVANYRNLINSNLVRTVADSDDKDAINYFDTIRINYKANTDCYFVVASNLEINTVKESKNILIADFFEISLPQIEYEEEAEVGQTIGYAFDSYIYGVKGAVPSIEFESIELVNKSGLHSNLKVII